MSRKWVKDLIFHDWAEFIKHNKDEDATRLDYDLDEQLELPTL